jgi:homoserine O-acetyltransferase
VVSFSSDWLFPPAQSRELVKALLANDIDTTYCNIQSSYGHDAFLLEEKTLGKMLAGFLGNLYVKQEVSNEK